MYAQENRPRSTLRLTFLLVILLTGFVDVTSVPPQWISSTTHRGSDQALHTAVIHRVHLGEPYYSVLAEELRTRLYPTASPLNWRTPSLSMALALNPPLGRVVFVALVALVLVAAVSVLVKHSPFSAVPGAVATSGAVMVIFDPGVWVFHEVWAGCLLALSVFAYDRERRVLGFSAGMCALFIRELAALYVLVCLALALRTERRREAWAWVGGLVLYWAYYAIHLRQVVTHQLPGDISQASSWLVVGGLSFVANTLRTNSLLHDAPQGLCIVVLTVSVAALMGRSLSLHFRLTVAVYFMFFCFVGQDSNWYWGWLIGFLLPLAFAQGLLEVRNLIGLSSASSIHCP